ncbi:hypothetical protein P7K49_039809 [Saguinus oedipus]|uniref:Uncharacterized protein n=1 Tax=Saguinus oedipus TaxID=9490 RepID=A0ABQ9TCB3_SAGOE|nr:hypothetical protein P7K49_039809 [Saguinus oedipus]
MQQEPLCLLQGDEPSVGFRRNLLLDTKQPHEQPGIWRLLGPEAMSSRISSTPCTLVLLSSSAFRLSHSISLKSDQDFIDGTTLLGPQAGDGKLAKEFHQDPVIIMMQVIPLIKHILEWARSCSDLSVHIIVFNIPRPFIMNRKHII